MIKMDSYSKGLCIIILFGLISTGYYLASRKKTKIARNLKTRTQDKEHISEALFFSQDASAAIPSIYSQSLLSPSAVRLLSYLSRTRHTLDVCMNVVTDRDIARVIMKLCAKGVKVRFIVDTEMMHATGSAVKVLRKEGIEMHCPKSIALVHHKFCLIDASCAENSEAVPIAMIGSLNWTKQALWGNFENVLVTSDAELVGGLKEEFEEMWVNFKPIDE